MSFCPFVGHRFKTLYDFGYCALDILYTYPEDNGLYSCIAVNDHGQDQTQTALKCEGTIYNYLFI